MAFVVSEGSVRQLSRPELPPRFNVRLADGYTPDYAAIWRSQPAVRTVVAFLARNIASLGIHTFERVSDTDRRRLTAHPVAVLLGRPNPRTTRYRMVNALIHDLGIYDVAYWLKLNGPALLRLPPEQVTPKGDTWMWPDRFEFRGRRGRQSYDADRVVHFHGYDPTGQSGASPIESLRRILAEEYHAGQMREQTLRNGARMSGYIERPATAPAWDGRLRQRFKQSWRSQYAEHGSDAGGTPVLEDGMTFNAVSQTSEQLQYVEARKLTREEVAAAYFIPPPMVGILEHATFSNITEQHKMLYQDTLGPWLTMIQEEIGLQLISDLEPSRPVYVEFNLAEKLRGSFEDQAKNLQAAVGAPWLLRNEARARMNLPSVSGGDDLVTPLNVLVGGQASPRDSGALSRRGGRPRTKGAAPATHLERTRQVLSAFFARQARVVKSHLGVKQDVDWWDADRWDRELSDDLYRLAVMVSEDVATATLDEIGFGPEEYDVDRTLAFLRSVSDRVAGSVNAATLAQLEQALLDPDDPAAAVTRVFETAETSRADQAAQTAVTTFAGFATTEAAKQAVGERATKTWLVTSGNPRASHAAMDGETVLLSENFSNGLAWPGDANGDADEVAGCRCSLAINLPD